MENNIVNWITGRSDLKQVPLEELKAIVHQYPYFTLAQLLLTVKMKRDDDPEYPKQLQKTALNFQNPQWLHFQLESLDLELSKTSVPLEVKEDITIEEPIIVASDIEEEISFEKEPQSIADLLKENSFVENPQDELKESNIEEIGHEEIVKTNDSEIKDEQENIVEEVIENQENTALVGEHDEENNNASEESTIQDAAIENENQSIADLLEENPFVENSQEENKESFDEEITQNELRETNKSVFFQEESIEEQTIVEESSIENTEEETTRLGESNQHSVIEDSISNTTPEIENSPVEENIEVPQDIPTENNIEEPISENEEVVETRTSESDTSQEIEQSFENPQTLVEAKTENNPAETDKIEEENEGSSRLSAMLEAQASAFKSHDTSKEELSFERPASLPTKDYFASIGVTIDNTNNTDFGQKVKRFSDWLKQMKKVEKADIDKQSDPNDEKIISQKAHDSNKPSSVVTETMAEVLIQQGKNLEAIETLEKLSLLKPEKSAYFASLITNLKNNI